MTSGQSATVAASESSCAATASAIAAMMAAIPAAEVFQLTCLNMVLAPYGRDFASRRATCAAWAMSMICS